MTGRNDSGEDLGAKLEIAGRVIGDAIERLFTRGRKIVDGAVEGGKKVHEGIVTRGGYVEAAKRLGSQVDDRIRQFYRSVEDSLCTDGEFDPQKAKSTLSDSRKAIGLYGEKAYHELSRMVSDGAVLVERKFREYIPTEEELATKYAGIGTQESILFRKDYDACLDYHREVERGLSKRATYGKEILNDIKASGSSSKDDLLRFYSARIQSASGIGSFDSHTVRKMANAQKILK